MTKRLMTLDDLYKFFVEQNKTFNFNSKESGSPIVVSLPGTFAETDDSMPGLLKLKLKVCHTQLNRNGSFISEENMEKGMPTLKYRPILAYIHELEDGTKDFYSHNVEIVENEDGESAINYIEKQVGCFTADEPWLEYDENMDKTYVMAYSVIPENYTEAADIIRRKNGTKVSCELVINELSYNAKEKYLDLTDFYFSGCTLLGCDEDGNEIGEGMLGARADIADFCHKEPVFTYQDKLIETLEKLNVTLEGFNKNSEEGGDEEMDNVEQVVTEEVVETTGTAEVVVEEQVSEEVTEEVVVVEEETVVEETVVEETSTSEDGDESEEVVEKCELKYELSHDDIRAALYALLAATNEDGYYTTWIVEVYDNKFIYNDYNEGKYYRQKYTKEDENVALDGDRVEVFSEWLTKDELDALDALKADYAALKSFKDNYDAAEEQAQKDQVFAKKSYEKLADVKAFKELKNNAANFSVDEIVEKAKIIYADFMEQNEVLEVEDKSTKVVGFNFNKKETKKSPYGNLFNKD